MTPITLADAEHDLIAAYQDGRPERIAAAEALVDRLDVHPAPPSLGSVALWYAEQGIPVFALLPGRKHPFGKCDGCRESKCPGPDACEHDQCHGLLDANLDPERITRWWTKSPNANIGLATGHCFDIVDIDGPKGQEARVRHWADIFEQIDNDSIGKVLTPRQGGMHIYVPPTGDGNSTEIVPGVDYRGLGGYCLAPPSVIAPGGPDTPGTYRWLGTPTLTALHRAA